MKKILSFFLVLTAFISIITSCSSDDENSSNSNTEIIGTWGTKWDNGNGISTNPKFTFLSNGKVKYYTYRNNQPSLEETGTWNLNGDFLIMTFTETVELKFKNKIIIINDNQIDFQQVNEYGYDSWNSESYFKTTDPNLN